MTTHTIWGCLLAAGLVGCAIGDGRGFATLEGTLTVEGQGGAFLTGTGSGGHLQGLEVSLVGLELSGETEVAQGTELRLAGFAIPGVWDPVLQTRSQPFGPLEVDRGDYAALAVVAHRLVLSGIVGDVPFRIEAAPEGGVRVSAAAALPANRDAAPNITVTARLILPDGLMEGTAPIMDPDGTAATVVARIEADAVLDASWVRKQD